MMTAWSYWRFLIHHLLDIKQIISLECLREDRAQRDQLHQACVQVQASTYWLRSKSQQLQPSCNKDVIPFLPLASNYLNLNKHK